MHTYDRLSGLPLIVDAYRLEGLSRVVSSAFERHTTVIRLEGAGKAGVGEDVNYEAGEQRAFQREGGGLDLRGSFTLDRFSRHLDGLDLFPRAPRYEASHDYRRWAFESAALDLALRQAGATLHRVLDRPAQAVRFVASMGLGNPPTVAPIRQLLERVPGLHFKLDVGNGWNADLLADLAATGAVDVVDFKGAYRGTPVDLSPDPRLYARVADALPEAWLEDPALTEATRPALAAHEHRMSWDAPIHSVEDIEALEVRPRMLNIKPSRFGRLRTLFEAYDHCRDRGISMYGGGQFELGPGRGQIQYLASLFHPDASNDVAPRDYHTREPGRELPRSPLEPRLAASGFRWEDGA